MEYTEGSFFGFFSGENACVPNSRYDFLRILIWNEGEAGWVSEEGRPQTQDNKMPKWGF